MNDQKFKQKLLVLVIGLTILCGIPLYFGTWCFLFSWLPGGFSVLYLDDDFKKEFSGK